MVIPKGITDKGFYKRDVEVKTLQRYLKTEEIRRLPTCETEFILILAVLENSVMHMG